MSLANLKRAILSISLLTALSFSRSIDARGDHDHHHADKHKHQECCDHHCDAVRKLSGTYFVSGFDPYLDVNYEGTLVIKHTGCNIYSLQWTFTDGTIHTGTGIYDRELGVVATSFTNTSDDTDTGAELITVRECKIIGRWVKNDQTLEGRETLVKVRC